MSFDEKVIGLRIELAKRGIRGVTKLAEKAGVNPSRARTIMNVESLNASIDALRREFGMDDKDNDLE